MEVGINAAKLGLNYYMNQKSHAAILAAQKEESNNRTTLGVLGLAAGLLL